MITVNRYGNLVTAMQLRYYYDTIVTMFSKRLSIKSEGLIYTIPNIKIGEYCDNGKYLGSLA